jgi:hypothetical protein
VNQKALLGELEALLGDLAGVYMPEADVRESIVEWLVQLAQRAAFGQPVERLERGRAMSAISAIECVVREPMRLETRIKRGRSKVRYPELDFFVEFRAGETVLGEGASPILSLAIMHAARSLARA